MSMTPVEIIAALAEKGVRLAIGDDGQLKVSAPKGAINAQDKELLIANKAAIMELLNATRSIDSHDVIPVADRSQPLPLSFGQERLWFLNELEPGSSLYNIPTAIKLSGELDIDALKSALHALIKRHESLRTAFRSENDEPVQVIADSLTPEIIEETLHDDAGLGDRLTELSQKPFDLESAPLIRLHVVHTGHNEHALLIVIHHIIADGWAMGVLMRELATLYDSAVTGKPDNLPTLPIQDADYASWQRQDIAGDKLKSELDYWQQTIGDAPMVLELPTDHPRPATPGYAGDWLRHEIDSDTRKSLETLAQTHGATLYMVLLSAFNILLSRYSGNDELLIGSPVANRNRSETENLISSLINTVVLRTDLSDNPAFTTLLQQTRDTALSAFEHQELPFEKLVEELQPERNMSHSPIYQVMFNLQNRSQEVVNFSGLQSEALITETGTAKLDLHLLMEENESGLVAWFEYATELFDATTIERMADHYTSILKAVAAHPDQAINDIRLLSDSEEQTILHEWNATDRNYPDVTLTELFEEQVSKTPDAVAVEFETQQLTYRDLDARANQLGNELLATGAGPESVVGVFMDRSVEMVVALYGIHKAGAAYLPLDPEYPPLRLAHMLEDAAAELVLTQRNSAAELQGFGGKILSLDSDGWTGNEFPADKPTVELQTNNIAYVIFTSGSTGRPKGVMNEHRGIVNRLLWMQDEYQLNSDDRVLQKTAFSFDVSVWEFFWPLITGARLVMARPEGHKDPAYLIEAINRYNITTMHFVPSMLQAFLQDATAGCCPSLQRVMCSGEALPWDATQEFYSKFSAGLHNLYGPTEAAIDVTYWPCPEENKTQRVPIGRPVANTSIYIVDRANQLSPVGVPGELLIGGVQVARGYINRDELTAERFIDDPFAAGGRAYRTGDLARYLPDGTVEYLGRIDAQIKLRGFRIELGEIDAALTASADIEFGTTIVRKNAAGVEQLVSYVVPKAGAATDTATLRDALKAELPDYMVPATIMAISELPLTPNGKLDRKALPEPEWAAAAEYVAPRNETEIVVAGIYKDVLGVERVGIHDDFFALGGHSLLATRTVAKIRSALNVPIALKQLFDTPTVAELAAGLADGDQQEEMPVALLPRDGALPLSYAQQRIWFLHRMDPASSLFNVPWAMRLTGALNTDALQTAVNMTVQRHESLRTAFTEDAGQPVQSIHQSAEVTLNFIDQPADTLATVTELARQPFNLTHAPLLRVHVIRESDDVHVMVFVIHHIIADGWSLNLLFRDVMEHYRSICEQNAPQLPVLTAHYADFANWQREHLESGEQNKQLEYWQQQLSGAPSLLELPTDKARPAVQTYAGSIQSLQLPATVHKQLNELATRQGSTLFMTLFAAFYVLMSRYSGQQDIVIGTPVAGRSRTEFDNIIGCFLNNLVIRADLSDNPAFTELLAQVKQNTVDGYAHQDLPFEKLVEELQPARDMSHAPLFQVMFTLQTLPDNEPLFGGLQTANIDFDYGTAKYDITWSLIENQEGLTLACEYAADLFHAETIARMLEHYQVLLNSIQSNPEAPVNTLQLLSNDEQQQLEQWNETTAAYPHDKALHSLFEEQAARTPDATAVEFGDRQLSYRELNERADALAAKLINLGASANQRVAICVNRDLDTLTGLLGILKSGAGYVPLDPIYPPERIGYMLEDSGAGILVSEPALAGLLPTDNVTVVDINTAAEPNGDVLPPVATAPGNLAYLIYTSGSTGLPKGVEIEHQAVVNFLHSMGATPGIDASDRLLAVTTLCFDISILELFMPLLNGAAVVIASQEQTADGFALKTLLDERNITMMQATPATWRLLQQAGWQGNEQLRVLVGGEALERDLAEQLHAGNASVWNMYGPTETTIWSACHSFHPADSCITVGKPIANTQFYVLDDALQLTPAGVPGELWIGGDGVARGYWQREELTAERFIKNPFGEGRLYCSGDRVRWLGDGTLEVLGRTDFQVKLRGFRIELGEIESRLTDLPAITQSVVILREDQPGDQRLVAYSITPEGVQLDADELREHLQAGLPDYMVPSAFVQLERFPLTPNGKIDRKALPAPDWADVATTEYVAPRNDVERTLCALWAEALGNDDADSIGIHDDFFALGGHSLLAVKLIARIRDELDYDLNLMSLFSDPSVAGVATLLESDGAGDVQRIPVADRSKPLPLSSAQVRLWFLDELEPGNPSYNMPWAMHLSGELNPDALQKALNDVVARHESLRTVFPVADSRPVQLILDQLIVPITVEELPAGISEAELTNKLSNLAKQPFSLSEGPLFAAHLFKLGANHQVFSICIHHIIYDAWSHGILMDELTEAYAAHCGQRAPQFAAMPVQFADYAAWESDWMGGPGYRQQLDYWKDALADAPTALEFPTDFPRPAIQTSNGGRYFHRMPDSLLADLNQLAQQNGATLFMVLLAAYHVLLARYSGQDDIVISVPISGRKGSELEQVIGFFLNTLAIRCRLEDDSSFDSILQQVRQNTLEAFDNQEMPFGKLVEELDPQRDTSRPPIAQMHFVLQHVDNPTEEFAGLSAEKIPFHTNTTKFDMTLFAFEVNDTLAIDFEYNTDLYLESTVARLAGHFENLLQAIVQQPAQPVNALPMLESGERQMLLSDWNATERDYPADATLQSLLEAQVERTPDAVALVFADEQLSYKEFNARANQMAAALIERGIGPESFVGVCLERSTELVIALHAIQKAGGAYVPLDPEYPQQRLEHILEDAEVALIITTTELDSVLPAHNTPVLRPDADEISAADIVNPVQRAQADNAAYVIFTSGSTGRPKGVMNEHRGIVNRLLWMQDEYQLNESDRVLQKTPFSFDVSVWEFFWPLLTGARLVVAKPAGHKDPAYLAELIQSAGITTMHFVPSMLQAFLQTPAAKDCSSLRNVICSGEALPLDLTQRFFNNINAGLHNLYGPTEAAIDVTYWACDKHSKDGFVPIGRPVANTSVYIVDATGQPVPVGVSGELWIGGVQVARGYVNRPELTAERFIPDPFSSTPGARVYKTGDLVRYREDGRIEFLGRLDHQVKLRGFRIELGEIETELLNNSAVQNTVVLAREDREGDARLVAYVLADTNDIDSEELEEWQSEQVDQWQSLWEDTYGRDKTVDDLTFDITGWDSSYTGDAIPAEEMREWVETTCERILDIKADRILEVGSGSGLLASRIGPHVSRYLGTDFSANAAETLNRLREQFPELASISGEQKAADQIGELEANAFDAVVVNSVAQYFPNMAYFDQVIKDALERLDGGGSIFLGDLRSLSLMTMHHASVQLFKADDDTSLTELDALIQQNIRDEEELVIEPAYFIALQKQLPQITGVRFRLKRGNYRNELSRFRYDVVLETAAAPHQCQPETINWDDTDGDISALISNTGSNGLLINGIPDARLNEERITLAQLATAEVATTGELKELFNASGIEAEDIFSIAGDQNLDVQMIGSTPGYYSVLLQPAANAVAAGQLLLSTDTSNVSDNLLLLGNDPLTGRLQRSLVPHLRKQLKASLPDYMVPSAFVIMDEFPLTASGKIDRKALPAPEIQVTQVYVAPESDTEKALATIFEELLGIDKAGINDDFFELGGHSLLATQLVARIASLLDVKLPLVDVFNQATIAQLALVVDGSAKSETLKLVPQERGAITPLSFAQSRLWFLNELDRGNTVYNMPWAIRLQGELHRDALQSALDAVIQRHEVLRTVFTEQQGKPGQVVLADPGTAISYHDLSDAGDTALNDTLNSLAGVSFDLATGPLIKTDLIKTGSNDHVLMIVMHHICSDMWSAEILLRETAQYYEAIVAGNTPDLPALPVQYGDFALWQQQWLQSGDMQQQLSYWSDQLRGAPDLLTIPTDRPRGAVQTYEGAHVQHRFPAALTEKLNDLAARQDSTLFMVLMAAFNVLLSRYANQQDILVGTPVAGRQQLELESLIGLFVNTLVIRSDLTDNPRFSDFVQTVRRTSLEAFGNQDLPFEKIVDELQPSRDMSHSPLFQVMFVLQNQSWESEYFKDLDVSNHQLDVRTAKFDLALSMQEIDDGLLGHFEYNTALFDEATITRMLENFGILLESIVARPDTPAMLLPMLSDTEIKQQTVEWNPQTAPYSHDTTLHGLIEQRVSERPDDTALLYGDTAISFSEMNAGINQLAHELIAQGAGKGALVGIALDRTPEMVIAILAVFKSGAAYLPLDPDYPDDRLSWMLEDSGTSLIISRSDIINRLPANKASSILLDQIDLSTRPVDNPAVAIAPDDLAYIIYTSGSTGRPKGVMLRHEGAANLLLAQAHELQLGPDDRLLQFASISFDASVGEITMSLGVGATLVLAPKDELMPGAPLLDTLRRHKITIVTLPPSALYQMQPEDLPDLRNITVAGEACPQEVVDRWAPGRRFINLYGPTENTVWATYDVCVPGVAPTLGKVVPNVEVFVLSEQLQPLPVGAAGELCLGGVALAKGYLHREDLTAEKFVAHPFKPGKRVYRTGDLVRFNGEGKLEFLGRIDHQVKVRGFRIELGEIEAALTEHAQVEECLVVANGDNLNDRELVAYLTPLNNKPELGELRRWLQQSLPDFMIPASFVVLDEFPLTPNGKIDREALPAADGAKLSVATEYVAPRNQTETDIAAVWTALLDVDKVGIHDNFFELGGHSLLATQLVARIRDQLHTVVQLRDVFAGPTVAEIAALIADGAPAEALQAIEACDRSQPIPLSFSQQRLWFLDQLESANPVYNIPWAMRLSGTLDVDALQASIDALMQRHEVLRTHFATHEGIAQQIIGADIRCELEFADMSGSDDDAVNAKVIELGQSTFNLSSAPLLRTWLLRLADDEHVFVMNIHHIICDGWSMSVLYRELLTLYRQISAGSKPELPVNAVQYADFAAWQRDWMESGDVQTQLDYWSDKLRGAPALLNLPLDRPRGTEQSHDGAHVVERLPRQLAKQLEALAAAHDSTLFMVLLAAFNVLLSRYSNQTDILVGTPVAGRQRVELEALVGFFVNTLVIRSDLDNNPSFGELLAQVKQSSLEAFDNQDLPFEKLVDEVSPTRDMSHSPLFQVMFTLQNQPYSNERFDQLEATPLEVDFGAAKFDLTLSMGEFEGELAASFEYNTALFDESTVVRMFRHFHNLLEAIVTAPDTAVGALPMLGQTEIDQQVLDWNPQTTRYSDNSTIHALIEAQAQQSPDAIAIRFNDEAISYADLNSRANQLAHYLIAQGAGRDTIVGLSLDRSPDIVISILAVFKSGAAYVPLDPDYPSDRLAHMLNDSAAGLLITRSNIAEQLPATQAQLITLDTVAGDVSRESMQNPATDTQADDLAYIIYTSGSTGLPKGVMLQHQGACNLVHAQSTVFGLGPADRMLQFASISFDASIFEILMGLGVGAELVMAPKDNLLPGTPLLELLQAQQVTAVTLPPSALMQMEPTDLPALRVITVAGEACPQELVDRWAPNRRFFNLYGPTEATVWSTFEECVPGKAPTIGKAVPNASVYILNEDQQPLPAGVAGELCLGGAGLARGYMNRDALTAEKFIANPYKAGERIYRSGDLVRFNPQGDLEFLGRIDHQVKVRGFRIELGEIETALAAHTQVRECVVLAHGESLENKQLLAYLVADGDAEPSLGELRSWLQQSLPDFMVPASFVVLDEFPLTPNGKIDRKALPDPDDSKLGVSAEYVAPRDHNEIVLADIWADLLGAERIGIHDNFFELGGDSILSIQIIARAAQKGLRITAKQLFQNQTIAELTANISADMPEIVAEQGRVLGDIPLTPIQHWYLQKDLVEPGHFNQSMRVALTEEVSPVILEQALHLLTDHHDALRLRFKQTNTGWVQQLAPFEDAQLLVKVTDDKETTLNRVQQRVSLHKGPLLKAALLQTGGKQELLLVVHHMAVDWVSWPVLLEDLELAYRKLDAAKPVTFPRKTTSFKAWSERLGDYAQSAELAKEVNYWADLPTTQAKTLPVDHPEGSNAEEHGKLFTVSLDEAETQQLLKLNARPQELLLAATGKAVADFTGSNTALFDLEGHGREDLFNDVSLARTAGWFTSIYPVTLTFSGDSAQSALADVKQQLQAIPNNGIGYGILKHLNPSSGIGQGQQAEIGFNYIGQADAVSGNDSLFAPSAKPRGIERSLKNQRLHKLDINCLQSSGCLYLNFGYSSELFDEASIAALAGQVGDILRSLLNPETALPRTAADFPLAAIDDAALTPLLAAHDNISDIYPLTPLQQGMLFHSVFDQKNDVYFASFNWLLEGQIDAGLFRDAWNFVINEHQSLRSAVVWQGLSEPLQLVFDSAEMPFAVEDWRTLPEAEQNTRLNSLLDQDRSRSFELTQAPLTRVTLAQINDNQCHMVWAFHHMMMDGWSVPMVINQVFSAYEALRAGEQPLPVNARPFRDYIEWLQQQDQPAAKTFWQDQLSGFHAPTPLPSTNAGAAETSPDTQEVFRPLTHAQGNKLKAFAQSNRLTVNSITQGAWALLLSRYSGEDDIVFGATTAGRPATLDGIESMVGLFLNTLPVRINTSADQTVSDWLQGIQEQQLSIQQYEYASLIDIQGWSDVPRGKPLFDSLLAFENYPDIQSVGESKGSIEIKASEGFDRTNFPLTLNVTMSDTLYLRLVYDRNVFKPEVIERLSEHLATMLGHIPDSPAQLLSDIPILTADEASQLQAWNETDKAYPEDATLASLLSDQAQRTPDAAAVSFGDVTLNYRELDESSNQLANYLLSRGIGKESLVGVCLERSAGLVIALHAIVKAGAAYVPMDPEYPEQRLQHMAEDAGLSMLLTHSSLSYVLSDANIQRVHIDIISEELRRQSSAAPETSISPDQAAYVIFTSGSTGRPKGVLNEHRGICNRLLWMQDEYQLTDADKVLQKTPFSFDVSVWEFFWPLISGAELVVAKPGGHKDSTYLAGLIKERGITTLHFVPSMLAVFLQDPASQSCDTLRHVICSGEALPYDLQTRFYAANKTAGLHNLYGPTEAAIDVSYWACERSSTERTVPIGRAVANTKLYVVDSAGHLLPAGVPGELWISGIQVARGYVNRPELTQERFIDDPFVGGNRVYKTGDLVAYRDDGAIEFLGRIDHQVKLRGFRIELGEIESVLTELDSVEQATVLLREDAPGLQQLVGYIVTGSTFDQDAAAESIGTQLPDYMVPSAWVVLDEMPLSPNGKVDRKALPAPEVTGATVEYIAPRDDMETGLAVIWQELLEVDQIGINDDFFALGGHSLIAMRVVTRARDELNIEIPLDAVFAAPSIAALAQTVKQSRDSQPDSAKNEPTIKKVDRASRRTRRKK